MFLRFLLARLHRVTGRNTSCVQCPLYPYAIIRAADWPKDPTWTGKLKITSKGKDCVITLLDATNKVFAVCPVTDGAVEKGSNACIPPYLMRYSNG